MCILRGTVKGGNSSRSRAVRLFSFSLFFLVAFNSKYSQCCEFARKKKPVFSSSSRDMCISKFTCASLPGLEKASIFSQLRGKLSPYSRLKLLFFRHMVHLIYWLLNIVSHIDQQLWTCNCRLKTSLWMVCILVTRVTALPPSQAFGEYSHDNVQACPILLCFTLLHFVDLCFLQTEGPWHPMWGKSVEAVSSAVCTHFVSVCHI